MEDHPMADAPTFEAQAPPRILKPTTSATETREHITKQPSTQFTKDAPKPSSTSTVKKTDFVVKDDPRIPNPGPQPTLPRNPAKSKFTTTMRQNYESHDIYQRVLGSDVTLCLGELLAVCPEIEKNLASETRLRTMPVTQINYGDEAVEVFTYLYQDPEPCDNNYEHETPSAYGQQEYNGDWEFVHPDRRPLFQAPALRKGNPRVLSNGVISSTGSFLVTIGDQEGIMAMVDSGAEMNMVTPQLAERLRDNFAEDESGKRYQMKNVSGVVAPLRGLFNNIPVAFGGHRFDSTFFIGEPWNSHFQAIIGQTFLQQFACELIWNNGGDPNRMTLKAYPRGDKSEDPIIVRLIKHNPKERHSTTASIGAAEYYPGDGTVSESDRTAPESLIGSDKWSEWSELSELSELSAGYSSSEACPEIDGHLEETGEPGEEQPDPDDESDFTASRNGSPGEIIAAANTAPDNPVLANSGHMPDLVKLYNQAINDYRRISKPGSRILSLEETRAIFKSRVYPARYRVPVGDRVLVLDEGCYDIRVNSKAMRMLLDPRVEYNVITSRAAQRAGLRDLSMRVKDITRPACIQKTGLEYCALVPIDIGEPPILPGLFLITDSHLLGGYDVISGIPWMIGIERQYEDYSFRNNNPEPPRTQHAPEFMDIPPSESETIYPGSPDTESLDHHGLRQVINTMAETESAGESCHIYDEPANWQRIRPRCNQETKPPDDKPQAELGGSFAKSL